MFPFRASFKGKPSCKGDSFEDSLKDSFKGFPERLPFLSWGFPRLPRELHMPDPSIKEWSLNY